LGRRNELFFCLLRQTIFEERDTIYHLPSFARIIIASPMTSRTHSTTHSTTVLERHHNSSAEDDTIRTSIILSRRHLLWPSPPSHYDASDRFALCAPSRQKKSNAKGGRNKDKSGEIELDPTDPADRAFKLVSVDAGYVLIFSFDCISKLF